MDDVYKKFELTKGNHLQYWFNGNSTQHWRQHPYEIAHCAVGIGHAPDGSTFLESLTRSAKVLYNRHGCDFRLFLSGGLDSEVALRVFYNNGYAVTPFIIKFANNLNKPDVENALVLCIDLGVEPVIFDFDPVKFVESGEWRRVAASYQCYTFYQQLLLYIAEQQRAPMITIDEIELQKHQNAWWFVKKEDQDGCWHRFVESTGIPAYNNFYTYDPNTITAFTANNIVENLINDRIFGKLSWTSSKHTIYTELTGFDMRNRPKRHGMEHMLNIWEFVASETSKMLNATPAEFIFDVGQLHKLKLGTPITCNII